MDIPKPFYRLPELAEKWGCSVGDILHFASQRGGLAVCVDMAGFRVRHSVEMLTAYVGQEKKAIVNKKAIWNRILKSLVKLDREDLVVLRQPGAFPYQLEVIHERVKEASYIFSLYPAFEIGPENLCVTADEISRAEGSVLNKKKIIKDGSDDLKTIEKSTLLSIIYGMATAAPYAFNPTAKRSEAAAVIASATAAAGCPVTDDTVRKWLKVAAEQFGKPNSVSN